MPAGAQVSLSVNIRTQPIWGPVGYDHVEYYYLPEIESYYYVSRHMFVYMENGRWVSTSYLPRKYEKFDLYNSRKIVINESRPYLRHESFRVKYATANEHSDRGIIRDSHDPKYFQNKNHPEHMKWKEGNEGKGRTKENGKNQKSQGKSNGKKAHR
jgi:hypothetical protein